jgi:hypothetical protein
MSEVSTSWNNIAEDQKIGDKVRLTLHIHSMTDEELEILEGSSRIYKTVTMLFNFLEYSQFRSNVMLLRTIKNYERALESLFELRWKLSLISTIDYDLWLQDSKLQKIKDLKLIVSYDEETYHEAIKKFVAKQKNLKRLEFGGKNSDFMKNYFEDSQFQLEFLKGALNSWRDGNCIFRSQQKSLETIIETSIIDKSQVYYYLKEFPKLKELQLKIGEYDSHEEHFEGSGHSNLWRFHQFPDENPPYPINTTITDLKLRNCRHFFEIHDDFYVRSVGLTSSEILEALPALVKLNVYRLPIQLMEFVARTLPELKILLYRTDEDGALERYEEMKQEENEGTNTNIEFECSRASCMKCNMGIH